MKDFKKMITAVLVTSSLGLSMTAFAATCESPDDGTGSAAFLYNVEEYQVQPAANPMAIIEGLPPGTTIELKGPLGDIEVQDLVPGGTLGGEIYYFTAVLQWDITGTGELDGFQRTINFPVSGEMHTGPRTPGEPVQIMATEMVRLQGEIFGDPDFCEFQFRAGSELGLPSPGDNNVDAASQRRLRGGQLFRHHL